MSGHFSCYLLSSPGDRASDKRISLKVKVPKMLLCSTEQIRPPPARAMLRSPLKSQCSYGTEIKHFLNQQTGEHSKVYLKDNLCWVGWPIPIIPLLCKAEIGGSKIQVQLGKTGEMLSQKNKRGWEYSSEVQKIK